MGPRTSPTQVERVVVQLPMVLAVCASVAAATMYLGGKMTELEAGNKLNREAIQTLTRETERYITRSEWSAWVQLCRAKGIDLPEPPNGR